MKPIKISLLLLTAFLPAGVLFLIQYFFEATYLTSSFYKIIFLLPIVYRVFFYRKTWKQAITHDFSFVKFKKSIMHALGWGLLFSAIYASAFFLFKDILPMQEIIAQLNNAAAITAANIIWIGLYIIVINSVLEEFFWRGFFFNEVHNLCGWFLGYVITGIGFTLYHVVYFYQWFLEGWLFALAVIGLFGYSLFMCMIFQKYRDLFTCWVIHAFVDVVQISIALMIFGII